MLRTALGTIFLALTVAISPACADDDAMSFTLGRLDEAPACGPGCAQFIVARGKITHATAFHYFFARKLAGDRNLPVILESPGGIVVSATFLARKWRELGVTVIVAHAEATCRFGGAGRACDPRDLDGKVQTFRLTRGAECASACPMLFAGGLYRLAMPDARFGVHRPAIDPNTTAGKIALSLGETQDRNNKRFDHELPDHFGSLGIDPDMGRRYLNTPNQSMEWMGVAEVRRYRLVNTAPEDLAGKVDLPAGLLAQIR